MIIPLFTTIIVFFTVQHLHNDCQHSFNRYENFSWNRSKIFHVHEKYMKMKYMEKILFVPFLHPFINCFRKTAMCYKSSMNNVWSNLRKYHTLWLFEIDWNVQCGIKISWFCLNFLCVFSKSIVHNFLPKGFDSISCAALEI